jgi:hypothetical protein
MIEFSILIFIYIGICIGGFKLYFYLQGKNMDHANNRLRKWIVTYFLFAFFILLEIPFAIFFPFWLNNKLMVVEQSTNSSMYLLLSGCLVLAIALWYGRKSRPKGF